MFELAFKVRDYECDLQGVVNNSVYQNYLEHARHEFLLAKGIDFAQFARENINLVVVRIELDYKASLTSGDEFTVHLTVQRSSKVRFEFQQHIIRHSDQKLILQGRVICTAVNQRGRPFFPPSLEVILAPSELALD